MIRSVIFLSIAVASVTALTCYTCDSFLSCNNPRPEHCPSSTQCYTFRENGAVKFKGCTSSCHQLPYGSGPGLQCTTCSHDHCNGLGSVPGRADQQPAFNNARQQRRSIGYGAGVQQPSIGSGVSGGSYGHGIGSGASVGGGYNNGGIGSGVGVEHQHKHHKHHRVGEGAEAAGHRIGEGAQTGGIGGGASPKQRHRREGNPGIGHGVQPKGSAGHALLLPFSLLFVRLFQ